MRKHVDPSAKHPAIQRRAVTNGSSQREKVVEYIRYTVPAQQAAEFEDAYRQAGRLLEADPHCLAFEIARGIEQPEHFIVRIEWDSLEGHEQGFRSSAAFPEFFAAVKPFFNEIDEMKHYELRESARA